MSAPNSPALPTVINNPGDPWAALAASRGAALTPTATSTSNDPWDSFTASYKQGQQVEKHTKLVASQKANQANFDKEANPSLLDITKNVPSAAGKVAVNTLLHPIQTGQSILGGLMDVGPAVVNTLKDVGTGMLKSIYGAAGFDTSKVDTHAYDLPLPGQTVNEYIGNNSDVSQAEQSAAKNVGGYELGGAAASGLGLGGVAVDALGNTIPRATLLSRVAGNVIGGQSVIDPNATLADRTKQAAFDAAFGVGDTAARGVAGALKAGKGAKIAAAAVTDAKSTVMNSAISSFEDASHPSYNPDIATKLRTFLDSKTYGASKNMVQFEMSLQKALGDDFNNAEVKTALQPIIDAGHQQVARAVSEGATATAPKKFSPADLMGDLDQAKANLDATPKEPPKVKLVPKDDLGVDEYGHKRMATTQVDVRTGNAVTYYDKSLDANPDAKKVVLDHEMGHVLDKQLNGGNNISSELGNYTGNKDSLDASLGAFAKGSGITVPEAAANLKADIATLGGEGPVNEQFADAVAAYRADPKGTFAKAPTFAKLMNYVPQDGAISEHSTSVETLSQQSPVAGQIVGDHVAETAKVAKQAAQDAKIASTGLDTGKTVQGKLSFNPDKIVAPQDVETLFSKMDAENENFAGQRMSKSNEDIKDLARLTGLKPEDLINAKPGSIANAETLTAARQLVLNKAQSFADHLKGVDLTTASDEQLAALKADYVRLTAMQQTVAGLRTEAANTLRSLQIEVQPGEDFTLKQAFGDLQAFGNKMGWDTSAFAGKVGDDLQKSLLQSVGGKALKTWYSAILSGPATYLRHFIGVGSNQFVDILSKAGNPKTWGEITTSALTAFKSVPEAWDEIKSTFGKGVENPNFNEVRDAPVFAGKNAVSKGANIAIEFTGRSMTSLAAGYKKIAGSVEGASLKVSSPEMTDDVSHALSNAYADQINYLDTPKGKWSQGLLKTAQTLTKTVPPMKLIIPFTRVVSNILDRQLNYLPGTSMIRAFDLDGGLSQQADEIMTKYGLTGAENKTAIFQRLKDQQIGRMVLGVGVSTAATVAAHAGMISGNGPADLNQKTELEQTGWRPNSFKVGDVWVPSAFLGPLSGIMLMAGNIADAGKYDKNIESTDITGMVGKGFLSFAQSELSSSFLSGIANLLGALTDPKKQPGYFKTLGVDLIPIPKLATFAVSAGRTIQGDDYQYKTTTIVDKIRAELGLTGTLGGTVLPLEPGSDALGRPLKADLIYGLTPGISKPDMVDSYLQANDVVITMPSKGTKYTDPSTGKKTALTTAQYNTYTKESGKLIYQNLEAMIPGLQGEDIDTQRAEIRSMLDGVRTDVRDQVLSAKK